MNIQLRGEDSLGLNAIVNVESEKLRWKFCDVPTLTQLLCECKFISRSLFVHGSIHSFYIERIFLFVSNVFIESTFHYPVTWFLPSRKVVAHWIRRGYLSTWQLELPHRSRGPCVSGTFTGWALISDSRRKCHGCVQTRLWKGQKHHPLFRTYWISGVANHQSALHFCTPRLLKLLRDLLSRFCAKFGGNQEDKSTFRKSWDEMSFQFVMLYSERGFEHNWPLN